MGYASYLVWNNGGGSLPLTLYGVQLVLNLAWSPLFFKKREIGFALLDITGCPEAPCATDFPLLIRRLTIHLLFFLACMIQAAEEKVLLGCSFTANPRQSADRLLSVQ